MGEMRKKKFILNNVALLHRFLELKKEREILQSDAKNYDEEYEKNFHSLVLGNYDFIKKVVAKFKSISEKCGTEEDLFMLGVEGFICAINEIDFSQIESMNIEKFIYSKIGRYIEKHFNEISLSKNYRRYQEGEAKSFPEIGKLLGLDYRACHSAFRNSLRLLGRQGHLIGLVRESYTSGVYQERKNLLELLCQMVMCKISRNGILRFLKMNGYHLSEKELNEELFHLKEECNKENNDIYCNPEILNSYLAEIQLEKELVKEEESNILSKEDAKSFFEATDLSKDNEKKSEETLDESSILQKKEELKRVKNLYTLGMIERNKKLLNELSISLSSGKNSSLLLKHNNELLTDLCVSLSNGEESSLNLKKGI